MASSDKQSALAHAVRMRDALRTQVESGVGVVRVDTDGVSVTYDRKQAIFELEYWEKKVKRLRRAMGRFQTIRLDNSMPGDS